MLAEELRTNFTAVYGGSGEGIRTFFAPGRINLIGGHTDYNGGHVFPCALTFGIYGAARIREDRLIRFFSEDRRTSGIVEQSLDDLQYRHDVHWVNYPVGVFVQFMKQGTAPPFGLDLYYIADMPIGAGLGTSAAIEVLTALMIRECFGMSELTDIDLAKAAMKAEQTFIGVPVGIMDPFTSAMGRKGNAIYLSTTMLKYNYVPLKFDGRRIIITDSRIKHAGSISAFLERKKECEKALRKFRSIVNIRALCDLSVERFETCKDVLMEPVLVKRARHVVCENFRTIRALSVFRVNKPQIFGKLMKESHISLRDDYEVTCPELDFLAEEAWKFPGVLGSRMTGRGFGGCTVSIVDTDRVDEFCSTLEAAYLERFQRKPNFYIADAGDGAREI